MRLKQSAGTIKTGADLFIKCAAAIVATFKMSKQIGLCLPFYCFKGRGSAEKLVKIFADLITTDGIHQFKFRLV